MGSSLVTGIDINNHSIKAVVLKPVGELYALVGYKELPITDDIFTDNHTLEYQKTVKKLKELRKGLPFGCRHAAISVPDNTVISKVLQIESELEDREKEFSIYQTFAHQSPFPIEELSLDFVKLDDNRFGNGSTTNYQVYATRKGVVESRSLALTKAGFRPIVVDTQAHGLLNIWQLATRLYPEKQSWMLVDIGVTQTSLGLISQSGVPFFKDIAFGTQALYQNDSGDEAANSFGSAQQTQAFTVSLIEKLKRQFQLYASVNSMQSLKGIWLTGEGAETPLLAEQLERHFQLACESLNPLALFENRASNKRYKSMDRHAFGIAAGMAVSGLKWQGVKHVASN
ncbi:type IV pilus assembly protein PilM [Vibrio sp. D404a]|uniref:type IV pilus assembly protein PilM n=1 Tax=unclassified Vibrio TaxID=2614977 RepID=UPI002554BB67|nr:MULTISPECIES: type IV pilus assembly protein PilM [unclassified Vibrio]MDK9739927.1 type IV pilus assembly protein PilM [Vibrio sp. D404a]MDK9799390.1 type IV pilus assembly protein PilM [Vibrio sp. D449a]